MASLATVAQWIVRDRDRSAESNLQEETGVTSALACILVQRGFADTQRALQFLNPNLDQVHPPELLPDFEPACAAIFGALERKETIYVHGDYDVDGVTSAALSTRFLTRLGLEVIPHVPHRTKEGYGIHLDAVHEAARQGAKLFFTCDCGIQAHEQVAAASELGMTVIVTDHHHVGSVLPGAAAVVNPHRADSAYPFKHLSGVGVVLKLFAGVSARAGMPMEKYYRAYLDLAALGTIADMMPLVDENRAIAALGLEQISVTRKEGLRALIQVSKLGLPGTPISARAVGFQLGPRINAVGRIKDSARALDLLLATDPREAMKLAIELDEANLARRQAQDRAMEEAMAEAELKSMAGKQVLVVSSENWHPGIVGLVAGRLTEKFFRPVFALTRVDNLYKGSARSIPGFNLALAIEAMGGLVSGGGHAMAAGVTVEEDRLGEFEHALQMIAAEALTSDDLLPKVIVDAELSHSEADVKAARDLRRLEPYGEENREPVFVCKDVSLESVTPTSKPEHVRLKIGTQDGPRKAMAFGMGETLGSMRAGQRLDLAFTIEHDTYNGRDDVTWIVKDYSLRA